MDSSNHRLGRRMGKKEDFQNQLGSAGREEVEPSDLVHTESNRSRFVVAGKRINSSRLAMQSTPSTEKISTSGDSRAISEAVSEHGEAEKQGSEPGDTEPETTEATKAEGFVEWSANDAV